MDYNESIKHALFVIQDASEDVVDGLKDIQHLYGIAVQANIAGHTSFDYERALFLQTELLMKLNLKLLCALKESRHIEDEADPFTVTGETE